MIEGDERCLSGSIYLLGGGVARRRGVGAASRSVVVVGRTIVIGVIVGPVAV